MKSGLSSQVALLLIKAEIQHWVVSSSARESGGGTRAYTQKQSLKIVGLAVDHLPSLDERREKAATSELNAIRKDPSHPFIPET